MDPRFSRRRLLKAIKRVQAVNRKLIGFERGFISKEGIKDREWYKHLGVAPGKWLGEFQDAQCVIIKIPMLFQQAMVQQHCLDSPKR